MLTDSDPEAHRTVVVRGHRQERFLAKVVEQARCAQSDDGVRRSEVEAATKDRATREAFALRFVEQSHNRATAARRLE